MLLGRALAVLDGRAFVLPEDVKEGAVAVLAHRLTLTPSAWAQGVATEKVVQDVLAEVATPPRVHRGTVDETVIEGGIKGGIKGGRGAHRG